MKYLHGRWIFFIFDKCNATICSVLIIASFFLACAPNVNRDIENIQDKNHFIRRKAAERLGELKDIRGVEPLIIALKDDDFVVRKRAVIALRKLKDKRSVLPLIQSLKDESAGVRREVPWALAEINDRRAVEPLVKALGDDDENVRSNAVWALNEFHSLEAAESFIENNKHLFSPEMGIRFISIGYKSDMEQAILGQLLKLHLKKYHQKSPSSHLYYICNLREFNNIQEIHQALRDNQIQGSLVSIAEAYSEILGKQREKDINQIYKIVKNNYKKMFNLIWLKPFALSRLEADFPSYAAPVLRMDSLKKNPSLRRLVNQLTGRIDSQTMARLVKQITEENKSAEEIARDFYNQLSFQEL